uniref:RING-type E3 ubiquitin transferase n=1 Tax=Haptolina brevifila TaxID=156173 RepID=A0A7S2NCN3_9EUKA|mmetsp:Transcript_74027/g.147159  ORF Transcript_74027/g.147159 Transcript_74027/m.147159 type:complete len:738 (+) Transcript_74027:58-2271(+)
MLGPAARAQVFRSILEDADHVPRTFPPGWSEEAEEPRFAFRLDTGAIRRTPLDPRFLPAGWKMQLQSSGDIDFLLMVNCMLKTSKVDPRGLPVGWRMLIDANNEPYFCCDLVGRTTYTDPRGLPDNCELRLVADDVLEVLDCFVDHTKKATTWHDPRDDVPISTRQEWLRRDLADYLARELVRLAQEPSSCNVADETVDDGIPERMLRVHPTLPHAVCLATYHGNRESVLTYLDGDGDINAKASEDCGTLLIFAASAAHDVEMVDMLLRAGAKVNAQDRWGCTALAAACCPLTFQPFRQNFLAQQPPPERRVCQPAPAPTCSSRRASSAASKASRKMARSIGRAGASAVDAAGQPEATPKSRRAIIERLVAFNADPNLKDTMGFTPLIIATMACEHLVIRTLLSVNADSDICDDHGMTALSHATSKGHDGIARLLRNPSRATRRPFFSSQSATPNFISPSAIAAADLAAEELIQADLADSDRSSRRLRATKSSSRSQGARQGTVAVILGREPPISGSGSCSPFPCTACAACNATSAASGSSSSAASSAAGSFWSWGLSRSTPSRSGSNVPSPPKLRTSPWASPVEGVVAAANGDCEASAIGTATECLCAEMVEAEAARETDLMSDALSMTHLHAEPPTPPQPVSPVADHTSVPVDYLCPITYELMRDPVLLTDGTTYERAAIEQWLQTHNTSPATNQPLTSLMVVPNNMARSIIRSFVDNHPTLPECVDFRNKLAQV